MKCKIFNIRLQTENFATDEEIINSFLENINPKKLVATLVQGNKIFWSILVFYEEKKEEIKKKDIVTRQLTAEEQNVVDNLKKWRARKGLEEGLKYFMVAHNAMLEQIVLLPVKTMTDFQKIKGFGEKRTEKYGEDILQIIFDGLRKA